MPSPSTGLRFSYSYEELVDHLSAMRTVCEWEETRRFGHVGTGQSTVSHVARVLDYFSDSYENLDEAVFKAERFLAICDYLARNRELFSREAMIETEGQGDFAIDTALLRWVHNFFTSGARAASAGAEKVVFPAKAFKTLQTES
jgi:hypothetical protein